MVAADRLERIPKELTFNAMGFEYPIQVYTTNCIRAPLYTVADLPKHKQKFSKPTRRPNTNADDDQIHISRAALREICKDLDPNTRPMKIQAILQGRSLKPTITMDQAEHLVNLPIRAVTPAVHN